MSTAELIALEAHYAFDRRHIGPSEAEIAEMLKVVGAPSLEELQGHLRAGHGIDPGTRGVEDLLTLHDNDHNRSGHAASHGHKKSAKSSAKGYAKF